MQSVVLINSLKKWSKAYTKIHIKDILAKIGLKEGFEIESFLVKSRNQIGPFTLNPRDKYIEFRTERREFSNEEIRREIFQRLRHIKSLEEQII